MQSRPGSAVAYGRIEHTHHSAFHGSTPAPEEQEQSGLPLGSNALALDQCVERFTVSNTRSFPKIIHPHRLPEQQLVSELDRLLAQTTTQSVSALPPNHGVRHIIRQILLVVTQSVDREEVALVFSQKIVQLLYKTQLALGREVYVVLLDRLCESSTKVAKDAVEWLIYAEDEVCIICLSFIWR